MMNFTCNECNDTGSRDKSGDYLDCGHCDAAMQRKALNDWLASQYHQGAIAKVDSMDAWLIHQRALAMAPKQEADHINDVVKMVALAAANGALPELPSPALEMTDLYTADQMRAYGQACAAAGPGATLVKSLDALLHLVDEFGIKSGVCCCGDDMARHSNPMDCGHSPVDSGEYYSAKTIEVARAALSGAKGN